MSMVENDNICTKFRVKKCNNLLPHLECWLFLLTISVNDHTYWHRGMQIYWYIRTTAHTSSRAFFPRSPTFEMKVVNWVGIPGFENHQKFPGLYLRLDCMLFDGSYNFSICSYWSVLNKKLLNVQCVTYYTLSTLCRQNPWLMILSNTRLSM